MNKYEKSYVAPQQDLLVFYCCLIAETPEEWVVDAETNVRGSKAHIVHLSKEENITLEEQWKEDIYYFATFTLPEWVAIDLEITGYCQRPEQRSGQL